jgi:hypothetical protein
MMTEMDRHWLAGILDARASISVSKNRNIVGAVSLNGLSVDLVAEIASLAESNGVVCTPATRIGSTYRLNFATTRGSQFLGLVVGVMRNKRSVARAEAYRIVFPPDHGGEHMKEQRLAGYVMWLQLCLAENSNAERESVVDKIKGD